MNIPLPPPPAARSGWPWTTEEKQTPLPSEVTYPKISIVTPSYQHGCYLEETMRSVLLQSYPHLEYIVIDGGSNDETVSLLKKYDTHLSYWVSEPDNGHAHAVNKGLARSQGEILAWLNAGDIYFPHALRNIAAVFQRFSEIDWLTSAYQGIQREGQAAFTNYAPGFSRAFFQAGGYLGFESFSLGFIQQESTFWRKSLWEHAGGKLNEALRVAHDFDLWHRFFAITKPALLDVPLACFRLHPDQRSVTQRELYTEDAWTVLGRKGNPWLARMYDLFHRSRLARFMDWRTALAPFYGENVRYVTQTETAQWQWQWRKLV